MGHQTGMQEQLFYEFRLGEWVPADHLLRKIDAALELSSLHRELSPFYSHTGRSVGRSRADGANVARRLLLRHPI